MAPDSLDLDAARRLLAEAGYPQDFGLTIHSSNDRFPEDAAVLQALGQMFTRGGIKMNAVVPMPFNVIIGPAAQQKFSLFLWVYNSAAPNASEGLKSLLATRNITAGMGGRTARNIPTPPSTRCWPRACRNSTTSGATPVRQGDAPRDPR